MKLAALLVFVLTRLAVAAPTQAELADKANQQGVELMLNSKFSEAEAKFRDAAARDPQAKYFFNLCTADYQQGKFGEALTACGAVSNNKPTPELQAKTDKLMQKIKDEAKAQKIDVETPADRAAKSNQEGVDLMLAGKYADAAPKFRDAVSRDPLAKYFFNLCTADYQVGKFGEALEACQAVANNKPTADLRSKSLKLIGKIREDARAQKINLE